MSILLLFILLTIGVPTIILILNKGKKANEIKEVISNIWVNIKELLGNLLKLLILIRSIFAEDEVEVKETETNTKETLKVDNGSNKKKNDLLEDSEGSEHKEVIRETIEETNESAEETNQLLKTMHERLQ